MLKIVIPAEDYWDEDKEEFVKKGKDVILQLEHSLVSISKWESKYHRPFLKEDNKTTEETIDYIRFMTLTQNVSDETYSRLTQSNIKEITDYIKDPMTATTFRAQNKNGPLDRRDITSELLYSQMISCGIPFECQKWHLNRLITLIKVCVEENKPKKKKGTKESAQEIAALNAARRAKSKKKR